MVIPLNYDSAIEKHLSPGERLLWVGRPRQGWAYRWHNRLFVVQAAWVVLALWWTVKLIFWSTSAVLGIDFGFSTEPTVRYSVLVILGGAITGWQLVADKRRRAGTWYAVTDKRILFVLTCVWPESAIGIEYDQIIDLRLNQRTDVPAPAHDTITFRLKEIDPFVSGSVVLGYQMAAKMVVLENLMDARGLYESICERLSIHNKHDELADALMQLSAQNDQPPTTTA